MDVDYVDVDYFSPEMVSRYASAEHWRTTAEAMLDEFLEQDARELADAAWKANEISAIASANPGGGQAAAP
jgi:hypothetical protein